MGKPVVTVLGTFHLRPSNDMVTTDAGNILGAKRQEEIQLCVERIARFRPTKVAAEVVPERGESLNEEYRQFRAGHFTLSADEVHQIAFRLADRVGHDQIYPVDWMKSLGNRGIGAVFSWARTNQPALCDEVFGTRPPREQRADESILEIFKSCNRPENVARDHRMYINLARIGTPDDYVGIDWLRWWYQRNLIIYVNLSRLVESPSDRILLLIGAGHVHLVSQFLAESGMVDVEPAFPYLFE